MTTTVRSVRVELEASVAGYIRDMKLAGAETDKAFGGAEERISATSRAVSRLEKNTANLSKTSAAARASETGLGQEIDKTGAATERAQRKTKAYTLEMALADEKASRLRKSLREQAAAALDAESGLTALSRDIDRTGTSAGRAEKSIDKYSGRLGVLADVALVLGPALIPLGAATIPLLTAALAGLGAAAGGIGVTVLALHGLADGLKALDAYQADKTPENLAKLDAQLKNLGPDGREFLYFIDDLEPKLQNLQNLARAGLLPGVEQGITDLLTRLPEVRALVKDLSQEVGVLAAGAGADLGGGRWQAFFDFLASDARPILDAFARSAGNVALGLANLFVAFGPLTGDVTGGLVKMTRAFADWTAGLGQNQGFQSFLDYIRDSGPQAIALIGSLAEALAAIVQAAAPYGSIVLPALTALADVFATIASSDIGGPLVAGAAALVLFNRGQQAFNKVTGTDAVGSLKGMASALRQVTTEEERARLSATQLTAVESKRTAAITGGLKTIGKGAALYAGLGIAASGAADGIGLTNTASLAMMGLIGGGWGAAVGAGVGLLLDWRASSKQADAQAAEFTATLDEQTGAITDNTRALAVKKLLDAGALQAAQDLGINLRLVTDAALGNVAAQTQLNAALAQYDEGGAARAGNEANTAAAAVTLGNAVDGVSGAVAASRSQFDLQAGAMSGATVKTNALRDAYDRTAAAAADLNTQIETLDNLLSKRSSYRAYQADLDNLRKSLKEGPHDWSAFTDAGRTNLDNLDAIVRDAAQHVKDLTDPHQKAAFLDDVIAQLHAIGKTSPQAAAAVRDVLPALKEVRDANKTLVIKTDNADALKKAAETSEALHDLATSKTRPRIEADDAQARHSINGVKGLMMDLDGTRANPKISANAGAAFGTINQVTTMLRNLNGTTATTYVRTVRTDIPLPGAHAAGGYIDGPGSKTSDSIPARLSRGEYVVKAAAVDRYGVGFMDALNNQRFADGGLAGNTYTSRRGPSPYADDGPFHAVNNAANDAARGLKGLQKSVEKVQKSYDKEKSKLDDLISQRDSAASAISSAALHDPFGNGLAGLDTQVEADTADIDAMTAALATLVHNGLDPKSALYQQLAASMDVNTAQQLAQLSTADLQARAQRFQHRSDEAGALGLNVANQSGLQTAIEKQSRSTDKLEHRLEQLQDAIHDLKDLPKHVHDATYTAARTGTSEGAEEGTRNGQDEKRRTMAALHRTGGKR